MVLWRRYSEVSESFLKSPMPREHEWRFLSFPFGICCPKYSTEILKHHAVENGRWKLHFAFLTNQVLKNHCGLVLFCKMGNIDRKNPSSQIKKKERKRMCFYHKLNMLLCFSCHCFLSEALVINSVWFASTMHHSPLLEIGRSNQRAFLVDTTESA